ncbi:MAG: AbrB family transcriptional regulator, partial [Treponema sp.]|nr:AbrB family transcriptional regulator [Treponema sp.]
IGIALICFNFTSMDHTTAFFASAPGGITDIVLISTETDANPLQISLIHSSRLFFALVFLPILSKHITSIIEKKWPILCASREKRKDSSISIIESTKKSGINVFFSLTVAVCGALTGFFLGIPAGTLVFSMVFTCIFNLTTKRAYIPIKLRKATQIFAGSIIGSSITMGNIMEISSVILPLIIILSGLIIMNLGIGILIFFLCKLDIRTALFSTIPAGATEMALIVDDLDGDGPKVALIQTFRLISVISIFPQVYFFIIRTFLT